jgi:hypothetical protein
MSNFITNKQDGVSTLGADEWNQIAEINNLITSSGQSLDVNLTDQVAKAIANYVNSGNFYTENGVANAYTLIASGNFKAPTAYINGMVVRFITTNANTTTTPTINVAGLGNKNIKKADGNSVIAGDITGYVELRYNGTDFLLSPLSSALNITATNKGLTYLDNPITIANNSTDANNDIDFSAGNFQFSDLSSNAVLSAMTKRLDASWTAGSNQGGLDTGNKANSTWYHCYAIKNPTSGVSDAIFSTNATTPSLPTGYTKYKYQGSIYTNTGGNITPFIQVEKYFEWKDPIIEPSGTLSGTITHPITVPNVPVLANISMVGSGGSGQTTANVSITGNNATPNANAPDFYVAFYGGQWDGPGSTTKLILTQLINYQLLVITIYRYNYENILTKP